MGLDMYLTKKYYVGAEYEHRNVTGTIDVLVGDKKLDIDFRKITYIETRAAYWRKANAIHRWFVENVQDGEDDCREYYVSLEQLAELKEVCEKILDGCVLVEGKVKRGYSIGSNGKTELVFKDGKVMLDPSDAKSLLPTQEGFFFGGTDYDEYYYDDVKYTYEVLCEILSGDNSNCEFYYSASW